MKRALIFTGGGCAPALNAVLVGAAKEAKKQKIQLLAGKYGWESLLDHGKIADFSQFTPYHKNINTKSSLLQGCGTGFKARNLEQTGGTILGTSRTNPIKNESQTREVLANFKKNKIDFLIPVGGDDTLGAANILWKKHKISVVCVPKTIDNDLSGTFFTLGFPTAAFNFISYCQAIFRDVKATRRVAIIETMGGAAGWLASCGVLGGADIIVIPEKEVRLKKFLVKIKNKYKKQNYVVVVVAHQANFGKNLSAIYDEKDDYKIQRSVFVSLSLKNAIENNLHKKVVISMPGNFLSAAPPTDLDKKISLELGKKAIVLGTKNRFGFMAAVKENLSVDAISLDEVFRANRAKKMDDAWFDFEKFRPKEKFIKYIKKIL